MNFQLDKESKMPAYEQICMWFEEQIKSGNRKMDEKLPAERGLAEELGVARNTVKQAYAQLCSHGYAKTVTGSGTYICDYTKQEKDGTDEVICETVEMLKQMGVGAKEAGRLLLESAWENLGKQEKLRMAWVDCSPELLRLTKQELEKACNITVNTYALDDIRENPYMLRGRGYSMVATTINHYDEIKEQVHQVWEDGPMPAVEKIVLSLSANVISNLVQIQREDSIAMVYDSEWLRYSAECYLKEFGKEDNCDYITMKYAGSLFSSPEKIKYKWIILPPDSSYRDGAVAEMVKILSTKNIRHFCFEQRADQGSLFHLRRRAQMCWSERGNE